MSSPENNRPANLEFSVEPSKETTILHCKGQITSKTRLDFRSGVVNLLHQSHKVVVDLGEVNNLDRSGMEMLVSLYSAARIAGATLKYQNLTTSVRDTEPQGRLIHKLDS